jgi:hypothetical protein
MRQFIQQARRRLGLPGSADRESIETSIRKRFPAHEESGRPPGPSKEAAKAANTAALHVPQASEAAVEYIYRIMDRQINKAIGLLAFDALLCAALTLVDAQKVFAEGTLWSKAPVAGAALALGSCLPLLVILWLKWGAPSELQNAEKELAAAMKVIWTRTHCLSLALYFSFGATLVAIVAFVKILWMGRAG